MEDSRAAVVVLFFTIMTVMDVEDVHMLFILFSPSLHTNFVLEGEHRLGGVFCIF